jgi:hypothetical protein
MAFGIGNKPAITIGRPASVTYTISAPAQRVLDAAAEKLKQRREAAGIGTSRAAADEATKETAAKAQRELDALELAVGLADNRGDEAEFARLNAARKVAAEAASAADDEVARTLRRQRAAVTMIADIDKELMLMAAPVAETMAAVRRDIRQLCHDALRRALIGDFPGGLIAALRLCHATQKAIGVPDPGLLDGLRLHDPESFEDRAAFPVRLLLDGSRSFVGVDASGRGRVEDLATSWADHAELIALHAQLGPLVQIERELRVIETQAADRADRERLFSAPRPRPELVQQAPAVVETDEEYSERIAADRAAAAERSAERERLVPRYVRPAYGLIRAARRGEPDPVNVPPAG